MKQKQANAFVTGAAPLLQIRESPRNVICHTLHGPLRQPRRKRASMIAEADAGGPQFDFDLDEAATTAGTAPPRYMPTLDSNDPVCTAVVALSGGSGARVTAFELLDSRWNGNEVFRYDVDGGSQGREKVFVKMNRVEKPEVFMSEAVGLTTLGEAADSVAAPRPLHVGVLPRVGEYGPGSFMILDWFELVPFGASRPEVQRRLGDVLADIHTSAAFEDVHSGRFGFVTNNFLALTPMDNTWMSDWPRFFAKRFVAHVNAAYKDKSYARAPLSADSEVDAALKPLARRIVGDIDKFFVGCDVSPSLLHGDLWIGNAGATKDSAPVLYDCACFFGHSELDLALGRMFGGFTDEFWNAYFARIPKAPGFEIRATLYELLQNLNQLNLFGDPGVKENVFAQAKELVAYLDETDGD